MSKTMYITVWFYLPFPSIYRAILLSSERYGKWRFDFTMFCWQLFFYWAHNSCHTTGLGPVLFLVVINAGEISILLKNQIYYLARGRESIPGSEVWTLNNLLMSFQIVTIFGFVLDHIWLCLDIWREILNQLKLAKNHNVGYMSHLISHISHYC